MLISLAILTSIGAAACTSRQAQADSGQAPPAPPVAVIEAAAQDVPIYDEFVAQTFARDMVEVRGRVDGYIEKRLFEPGQMVRAGQPLYQLDRRPYEAEVQDARGKLAEAEANLEFARKQVSLLEAQAALAQAEANLLKARQDVDRLTPLVASDAAPRQDLDNAQAALIANQANVEARRASVQQAELSTRAQIETAAAAVESGKARLRNAQLNLEYATIYSPIEGRVGDSLIPVGGLVSRNSPAPLTTVVPLDPIWVRFKVSEQAQQEFRNRLQAPLELVLAGGQVHPFKGRIQNTLNQVDPKTGTLEVQAAFSNPAGALLAGQFARVRVRAADQSRKILIPQRAVQELQGLQSVLVVAPDNTVQARTIRTGERSGGMWVVEEGLKPGDRVIVEGLQKAAPGSMVNPRPYRETDGGE
jgi:membrane fusion protein (multidrug efflux system)